MLRHARIHHRGRVRSSRTTKAYVNGEEDQPNDRNISTRQKAEMFERAEGATDPISRQHYREMAAHYRKLRSSIPMNVV
jgi:hypothetical protein